MATQNTKPVSQAVENKSEAIAALERKIAEAKSDIAKKALKEKLERLKQEAQDSDVEANKLAMVLLKQRKRIKELAQKDFDALIRRLAKKSEYSFLKNYTRDEIIRDMSLKAKPVGWRFKGKNKYKIPSKKQVTEGVKNGTVYYENRPKRSDVSFPAQLGKGGYVSKGEMVWKKLSASKKAEFLYENFTPEITLRSQELLVGRAFKFLPKNVKIAVERKYANEENYGKGGGVDLTKNDIEILGVPRSRITEKEWQSILRMAKYQNGATFILKDDRGIDVKPQVEYEWYIKEKYAKGGSLGNSLEEMSRNAEAIRTSVKMKFAIELGIDKALALLNRDWAVSPYNLLSSAVLKGFITLDDIDKKLVNEAINEAEDVDDYYKDSGEGIGSSDMNAFIRNMLKAANIEERKMAKGGGVGDSKLQRKVDEVNRLIKLVNDNDLTVVNSSSTWETPMKYQPIVVTRGGLKITYKELDLYKYNKTGKQNWEEKKETVLKRDMEFDNPLNDIAKWHRKALRENDIMFEDGGEIKTPIIRTQFEEEEYEYGNGGNASEPHRLEKMAKGGGIYYAGAELSNYDLELIQGQTQSKGVSIKQMRQILKSQFPDSFGFTLHSAKNNEDLKFLKPDDNNYNGIDDESIKIYFDKYHGIDYRVYQGGENSYFYFLLISNKNTAYIGQFGFKDEGEVPKEYVTSFISFLQTAYGQPFKIHQSVQ
jgi:hypothetical protein